MRSRTTAYIKFLRIPGLGGLAIPPIFGALSVGVYGIYDLSLLFIIGSMAAIFGFVLNDYADVELDGLIPELNQKPLVRGDISQKMAITICFVTTIIAFFMAFFMWNNEVLTDHRMAAMAMISLAWLLATIYNLFGKRIIASDLFVALAMSLLVLFGGLAFDILGVLTWTLFVLTFNQTLHMNAVEGGIKDADHDYLMGVNNLALNAGVSVTGKQLYIPPVFKGFGLSIRLISSVMVFVPFYFGTNYYSWQIALLASLLVGVMYIETQLLWLNTFDRSRIRKLIAAASFLRYAVVPVMLMATIGIIGGVVLAILPMAWYVAFSPLTGVRAFQPEM